MQNKIKTTIVFLLSLFFVSNLFSTSSNLQPPGIIEQSTKIVRGKVVDKDGQVMIGINIVEKGNENNGTITDADGKYSISVKNNSVLRFSFLGYEEKSVRVGEKSEINLTLLESQELLDEVIVIGYGTQSKKNVTGAISKINMNSTRDFPNTSVTQSLRGRVAGVQFTDNGRPGQNGSILIRGPRSLSAANNPLIVLDGTIYNGTISDINPNDIASMEVLKDASAAAIYGARAANGVILITSNRGKTDKPTIKVNVLNGYSEAGYKVKLLSPSRYIKKTLDYRREMGLEADIDNFSSYIAPNEAVNYQAGKAIDPWDYGTQNGGMSTVDISVSGKSSNTNYYMSAAFAKEKGIIKNDNQNRFSFRINIENNITSWLTVGTNSMYARRDFSGAKANINQLLQMSPFSTPYHEDGTPREFVVDGENVSGNALYGSYYQTNENIHNNLFSVFYANLSFPFIEGLSYRINLAPNLGWRHNYTLTRQDEKLTDNRRKAGKRNVNLFDWQIENTLTYKKAIGAYNFLDITLLYSRNGTNSETTQATANFLSTDLLGWNNLGLADTQIVSSGGSQTEGVSQMFRLNHRLFDRYLTTFTVRRDGSSVFSDNNKYAILPSAAFSWIVSDENFLKEEWLNLLKVRVSYGAVGNQAISPYQSLDLFETNRYVFGNNAVSALGYYPKNMPNKNLKWETTYTTNIGVDFELLDKRISGTIEWYNMSTKDLLVKRSIPRMNGFSNVWDNLGEVNNKGLEITLNTLNLRLKGFEWSTGFVFSTNKNKIVHLYRSDTDGDGKEDDDIKNSWFIGQPIKTFYDYDFDGIYQEEDDMPLGFKPGYIKVKDVNGDGKIDSDDRTIIGYGDQPKYKWGISNDFRYKNFSVSIFVNAMHGWIKEFPLVGRGPVDRSLNFIDYDWWTPENRSNTRPSLSHENKYAQLTYISRDFIRIQDISLSYDFPEKILSKIKLSALRLMVSGKNIYTFTNWIGSDPESGEINRKELYPMPRTIAFGLNMEF